MRPQGTIEECQARIVSQKLGVQGCFCRKAHCLLNFCLQGVGGWGLRRASRREVRTLRRFRKDRGVQFFRGRRTLCFAGGRAKCPARARPQARAHLSKEKKTPMGEETEGRFSTSGWTAPSRLSNLEENPGAEWNQERAREPRSWGGDPGLRKRGAGKGSPGVGRKTGLGNGEEGAG